jgi:cyclopropane fatty-acyl-phospholipid synthase-like methyltransferase
MEPYVRLFARFKVKCDPMFPRLAEFVRCPRRILDIGCGYGVPAVWLLECNSAARVRAIEPDSKRAAVAARAIGARGAVEVMAAPDLPADVSGVDHVLILDVIHLLDESELRLLMERVNSAMDADGTVVLRATVPSGKSCPWERRLEEWRLKLRGKKPLFRNTEGLTKIFSGAGFRSVLCEPSAFGREETWFILKKGRDEAAVL